MSNTPNIEASASRTHLDSAPEAIENKPNGFCIIHVDLDDAGKPVDWTFVQVNDILAQLEGMQVDDMVGRRYGELFPDKSRKWIENYHEAAYEGKSFSVTDISEEADRYLHIEAYPAGQPGCCACLVCNIRESVFRNMGNKEERDSLQKLYEEERMQHALASERSETISALSDIYSTIVDGDLGTFDFKIVKCPEILAGIKQHQSSFTFDKIMELLIAHAIHEDMRGEMREFLNPFTVEERLESTDTLGIEYKTPDGGYFEGRFVAKSRDEKGHATSVLFVARNITAEKQKELDYLERLRQAAIEAEKANVSKTNFLRRMSHDIRTPLNGIIGMLRIMDRNKGNRAKYEECMDKIARSSDYLLTIVNNVLDVGKMESGEIELEHKTFDLGKLLLNTLPIVESNARRNSIEFLGGRKDTHITHRYLMGSPVHLNRVLMNLASNAVKYNHAGGSIRLYCNELKCDGARATYEFVCEDTGVGMSEEFQKRAFEPFTQEGKASVTSFSGSGLGLSIVKEIVGKMDGTIDLKSKENVGTTIRIVLGFELDGSYVQNEAVDNLPDSIDLAGRKALLVEDNDINMEIAYVMLEEMDLAITCAKNGQEAVDIFESSQPYTFDFVFMDMMMPVMDGIEATREIRSMSRPDAQDVPIIAMTANAFTEDKQACLDAGMNDHIGKPFSTKDVIRALVNFVR